ncbi:type IV toxin-antitoxin system AbiEi family antitoxin domain-containing protein [Nocardioides sp. CFH 31398]|uniref:type IV toxin-antitoxin system AbiEi family antitoxin domain-containing protein n=1 Tax=Nocardioides sp. CFH 31398 TaxID=2919579 RepID=UPI001F05A11E|nr:type IV toxin-antitoxin system AbiEi family antitoxin domain-containing protein [Nocardioides sp. CFH 31398]MCH1865329.1 hypothetical protein [Nocardioides sp. CFH 31398]
MPSPTSVREVRELLDRQDGVISRRQAVAAGVRPKDLCRMVDTGRWSRPTTGVLVDHCGPLTGPQRAWVAVLSCWPAGLYGASVLRPPSASGPVHVAIERRRSRPRTPPWVVVKRLTRFDETVRLTTSPPRQRLEDAVLCLAADARDDLAAVGVLAQACGDRRTTPERLLAALELRPRLTRRTWIAAVPTDLRAGTTSVLEHGYLVRVERAHGLPRASWQDRVVTSSGTRYRDASYDGQAVVELDGRAHHASATQREDDLQRDLELAAQGGATVRLGYRQVFGATCRTTVLVVRFLRSRGVRVEPHPCGSGCPVATLADAA